MSFFIYILHCTRSVIVAYFLLIKTIWKNLVSKFFYNFSFMGFSFSEDFSFTLLANGNAGDYSACSLESSELFTILITEKHFTLSMVGIWLYSITIWYRYLCVVKSRMLLPTLVITACLVYQSISRSKISLLDFTTLKVTDITACCILREISSITPIIIVMLFNAWILIKLISKIGSSNSLAKESLIIDMAIPVFKVATMTWSLT